jgi:DNA-binding protein YbaB
VDNPGERELAEILGHAQSMADAVRSAFRPLPEVAEASDDTGAVTVTVAGHGTRVTRVMVAADWKHRLEARQLGMAVMQAVLSVQLGPVKDFFAGLPAAAQPAAPPPQPAAGPGPAPWAVRPQPGPAVVADLAASLTWDDLGAMLETVQQVLDTEAALGPREPRADVVPDADAGKVAGHSGNRRVEVTLRAGQLASVTIDETWAGKAGRQQLSDSLREAFEAAYAAVPQAGPGPYAGLAADLRSIVSRLGVPLPPQLGKDG